MPSSLNNLIREIPDFPQPGIIFKDITPLLANSKALLQVSKLVSEQALECDFIAGIEARGFVLASAACALSSKGFIPIRKSGKLPGKTVSRDYDLEYGKASLEVHTDLIPHGSKVLLVVDVLATGGTAIAATNLLKDIGLTVSGLVFLLDIPELNGKARIKTTLNDPQMTIILAN